MNEPTLCVICDKKILPDAPIALCLKHMQQAYLYVRDRIEAHTFGPLEFDPARDVKTPSVVYYVLFGDRIKIGTSYNLQTRLHSLPCDELLATEPGDSTLERERHWQFRKARITRNGEWFRDCPELRQHIDALRQEHGIPKR